MDFDTWPEIRGHCPLCGKANCATFRGYYTRFLFCTELEFFGRVAIRTGYCKSQRRRFSFLPDFLFPYRRISLFSLRTFLDGRLRASRLVDVIDDMTQDLGDEFYLPLSTAYSYLNLPLPQPP